MCLGPPEIVCSPTWSEMSSSRCTVKRTCGVGRGTHRCQWVHDHSGLRNWHVTPTSHPRTHRSSSSSSSMQATLTQHARLLLLGWCASTMATKPRPHADSNADLSLSHPAYSTCSLVDAGSVSLPHTWTQTQTYPSPKCEPLPQHLILPPLQSLPRMLSCCCMCTIHREPAP
jgi:hypothetical protein